MAFTYFAIYRGRAEDPAAFFDQFRGRHAPRLAALPGLRALRLLTRATYDDPFLREDDGPLLVAALDFATADDLARALDSDTGRAVRDAAARLPGFAGTVAGQAMQEAVFAVPGRADPDAPACYFVEYRRPAEDEAAFVAYYRDNHPPLLAELPAIRQIAIYTPADPAGAPSLPDGALMLINLVAFDSLDALNAALRSEARVRLREDFDSFPPFSGTVTHTAMLRETILP